MGCYIAVYLQKLLRPQLLGEYILKLNALLDHMPFGFGDQYFL